MIRLACPACNIALESPPLGEGRKLACPGCGGQLLPVPAGNEAVPGYPAPAPAGDEAADTSESRALQLVSWLTEKALGGIPPLSSADALAQEYLINRSFPDDGDRIDALINWETSKNFTSGFLAGLGGILTLPVTVPAAFAASWVIQARMSAAIARIARHDVNSARVQTFVVAVLVGDDVTYVLENAGVELGKGLTKTLISQVPGKVLVEINRQVGARLIAMAGYAGAVGLIKAVPFVGGAIGGTVDALSCRVVGKRAKELFYRPADSEEKTA